MDIMHPHCAGLDVHKDTVVACIRHRTPHGKVTQQTRTFATHMAALLSLLDWLQAVGVSHAAMESTGVYWKPVFRLLEGHLHVLLVNAHHVKQVPGRKTDVKDAAWLAELLQHGLLRASFVPPAPVRALRDLTRQRTRLAEEKAAANRIQEVLEDANIKLASVATDILGESGRDMLRALIAGETDPVKLAERADAAGQPLAEAGVDPGGLGGQPHEGGLPVRAVSAAGPTAGSQAVGSGVGPHTAGDRVSGVAAWGGTPGTGGGLPGQLSLAPADAAISPPPGNAGP
jgi:hypothetical protein